MILFQRRLLYPYLLSTAIIVFRLTSATPSRCCAAAAAPRQWPFAIASRQSLTNSCPNHSSKMAPTDSSFHYPHVRRDEKMIENLHDRQIADPYRYLEDPDAEETKAFCDAQNNISRPYMESYKSYDRLKNLVTNMFNFERYGCPFRRGERFYYNYNSGLQNQNVMFVQDELNGPSRVFFDPNTLSEDGTVAMMNTEFSEDNKYMAYMLSVSGSDWRQIKIRDVESGEDLTDHVDQVKFSCLSWTHDTAGYFYNRYPEHKGKVEGTNTDQNYYQKLMYHQLGTDQSEDILAAEFDDKEWKGGAQVSDCGNFVVLSIHRSCERLNELWIAPLKNKSFAAPLHWTKVFTDFKASYDYITNEGNRFYFITNDSAPLFKIISVEVDCEHEKHIESDFVPMHDKNVLDDAWCVNGDKLALHYMEDVKSALYLIDLGSGKMLKKLPLDIGCVTSFSGRKEENLIFYKFQSFITPGIVYRVDLASSDWTPTVHHTTNVNGFDASLYTSEQVFYTSGDGTRVPMFITHRKGMKMDGTKPALLYAYGGFHIAIQPSFSVRFSTFLTSFDGIVAVANIRGGLEYGEAWWSGGSLKNKQNCFDDFHAAAEFLAREKYTTASKITILGGSNGGLLVGACANQRPELYGAAIPIVGVMDMLRFHKFTIGHYWVSDYGNPDGKEDFDVAIEYSPLHNIEQSAEACRQQALSIANGDCQPVQYPATLVVTADHDDRVAPLHSLKYIAELQYRFQDSTRQSKPLMARIETKAGHGAGKPVSKQVDEVVDAMAFIGKALHVDVVAES